MKVQASKTYTVRGVPADVDSALRKKAALRKLSLNQVIVEELTHAVGNRKKKADYSDLVGTWKPDPELDAALADQRKIDWSKWK